MDYPPPVNQPMNQPVSQPMDQSMNQSSSLTTWYVVGAIVVIAALAIWYFYPMQSPIDTSSSALEESQTAPVSSSGNTTADILADLNQTSDDSAALNSEAAASAQAVSGF